MQGVRAERLVPLVGVEEWSRLQRFAEGFPARTQTLCLECRLGADANRSDLAFNLFPGVAVAPLLEVLRRTHAECEVWTRVSDFLDAWGVTSSSWAWRIPFVCVAFDIAGGVRPLLAPCLSLCIDPNFFIKRMGFPLRAQPTPSEQVELARDCFARVTGQVLQAAVADRIARCLSAPVAVEAKHLSFMLPRAGVPVKLDVRLRTHALAAFLEYIEWPAPWHRLECAVRALLPWDGTLQLNLPMQNPTQDPSQMPLEVEVFADSADGSVEQRFWLLAKLVETGLCDRGKAGVLHELWSSPSFSDSEGRLLGTSWYLKLRFSGSTPADAKAYLGFMPRMLQRRERAVRA